MPGFGEIKGGKRERRVEKEREGLKKIEKIGSGKERW